MCALVSGFHCAFPARRLIIISVNKTENISSENDKERLYKEKLRLNMLAIILVDKLIFCSTIVAQPKMVRIISRKTRNN